MENRMHSCSVKDFPVPDLPRTTGNLFQTISDSCVGPPRVCTLLSLFYYFFKEFLNASWLPCKNMRWLENGPRV